MCDIVWCIICSRVSHSGPANSCCDPHPVSHTCDLSPTPCSVRTDVFQPCPRLCPHRSLNGLCCFLTDPTQRQRHVIGGWRSETCACPHRRPCEQLCSQSCITQRSSGLQTGQGHQGWKCQNIFISLLITVWFELSASVVSFSWCLHVWVRQRSYLQFWLTYKIVEMP